jgi:hypothetical protein
VCQAKLLDSYETSTTGEWRGFIGIIYPNPQRTKGHSFFIQLIYYKEETFIIIAYLSKNQQLASLEV